MLTAESELENLEQTPVEPPPTRLRFPSFLRWLLIPPALLYLSVFVLVLVPALRFERWGSSKWGPVLQFAFDAHKDADVLIFGDSSAFLGVDPRLINAQLGITSVVLPNTIGSLPITGELSLQRYLAHNRPPKLIVLYFTAWDLDYQKTAASRVFFEGEEMLLLNGSPGDILHFARLHPLELLAFPLRLNSTVGLHLVRNMLRHADREQQTSDSLGHVDYTEPYPPMGATCELPQPLLQQHGDNSVRSLANRYAASGTRVLVYLAPMPGCSNAGAFLDSSLGSTHLDAPAVMPPSFFAADGLYAHPEPPVVRQTTQVFIDFLRRHAENVPSSRGSQLSQARQH